MNLDRCRILLVEDEYMLARDLRRELEGIGATVLGPEPSVERALSRIADEPRIDAAILDVNLGDEQVFPVAEELAGRHVPFLFSTGYQDEVVKIRFPNAITCEKPLDSQRLLHALQDLGVSQDTGPGLSASPDGAQFLGSLRLAVC